MGDVWLSVETRREPPPSVDLAGWEEVVEVSVRALGRLDLASLASDVDDPFPSVNPGGSGDHRLRVHARGRDHNIDGVDFEPVEEYLLIAWPGPPGPEVALKQTDGYWAEYRRSAASQPPLAPPVDPPATAPLRPMSGPAARSEHSVATVSPDPAG